MVRNLRGMDVDQVCCRIDVHSVRTDTDSTQTGADSARTGADSVHFCGVRTVCMEHQGECKLLEKVAERDDRAWVENVRHENDCV